MNGKVRLAAAGILGLSFSLSGCFGSKPPSGPAAGVVSSGTAAADPQSERMASEAASDLGFLHFAFTSGKTPERTPKDLDAAALSIKVIDERIYERVKKGNYVIHWDTPLNAPIVAYEKDAPTLGGWVLPANGVVTKMSADQVKQLLEQKGG